jgi:UDPglucose 6-dehydrogenase
LKVAVIGLGKIGLPIAALARQAGNKVTGIDSNKKLVKAINDRTFRSVEYGLNQLLDEVKLEATTDYSKTKDADIIVIMLPSPSMDNGFFTSEYVLDACNQIEPYMDSSKYRVIDIVSTLMPGEMNKTIAPIFRSKGNIGLCYTPTFVAIGDVIKGLALPDGMAIGQSDNEAGRTARIFWQSIIVNSCEFKHMSFVNAELSKLLLNCFITTKISIANTCAQVCEQFKGGNSDTVMDFLGLDSRIGKKSLKGGLGYGGTCFPRDSRALVALSENIGINAMIQIATDRFNFIHDSKVLCRIINLINHNDIKDKTISWLGLAYKTEVDLVDESNALKLAVRAAQLGIKVKVYDPKAMNKAQAEVDHPNLLWANSIEDCIANTDLCVVAVPWQEFKDLYPINFKEMRNRKLLDCWRIYDREIFKRAGIEYHAIGIADD